jgi:hypothetical protein
MTPQRITPQQRRKLERLLDTALQTQWSVGYNDGVLAATDGDDYDGHRDARDKRDQRKREAARRRLFKYLDTLQGK